MQLILKHEFSIHRSVKTAIQILIAQYLAICNTVFYEFISSLACCLSSIVFLAINFDCNALFSYILPLILPHNRKHKLLVLSLKALLACHSYLMQCWEFTSKCHLIQDAGLHYSNSGSLIQVLSYCLLNSPSCLERALEKNNYIPLKSA